MALASATQSISPEELNHFLTYLPQAKHIFGPEYCYYLHEPSERSRENIPHHISRIDVSYKNQAKIKAFKDGVSAYIHENVSHSVLPSEEVSVYLLYFPEEGKYFAYTKLILGRRLELEAISKGSAQEVKESILKKVNAFYALGKAQRNIQSLIKSNHPNGFATIYFLRFFPSIELEGVVKSIGTSSPEKERFKELLILAKKALDSGAFDTHIPEQTSRWPKDAKDVLRKLVDPVLFSDLIDFLNKFDPKTLKETFNRISTEQKEGFHTFFSRGRGGKHAERMVNLLEECANRAASSEPEVSPHPFASLAISSSDAPSPQTSSALPAPE